MKNFEDFVNHIVVKWKSEKKIFLEKGGQLGMPSNRQVGDLAEKYIVSKIDKLSPSYTSCISKGSQTPADVYSVARRHGYWHIMLIQIKSSRDKNLIYKLNTDEIIQLEILAKFVKSEIEKSLLVSSYKDKPIVISFGYAGVFSNQATTPIRHYLNSTTYYKMLKMNFGNLNLAQVKEAVSKAHEL